MAFCSNLKDSTGKFVLPRIVGVVMMCVVIITPTPSNCNPITKDIVSNEPWWCQPCKSEHRTRHSRGINEPLKNTFEIAIKNYETQIAKYVKHLQSKIGHISRRQIKKNTWLPRKKFFRSLREDDAKMLPEVHYQIQVYAVTIQRLINMEVRTEDASYDADYRFHNLNMVKSYINLLRCETEQEIAEKRMKVTKKVPVDLVDKKIPAEVIKTTDGYITDFSILTDYYNFIRKTYLKVFGKPNKSKNKGAVQKNVSSVKNQRTPKNSLVKKTSKS